VYALFAPAQAQIVTKEGQLEPSWPFSVHIRVEQ
jgi:hypothetical protein